ncbi:MAG: ABC transporter ATP-binding protein [Deltaproteobacteria bacterium]|nr:ABC transporter ATP-binding protein [Deltaproteobacteria bacterium]
MLKKESIGQTIQAALRLDRAVRLVWQYAPGWSLVNLLLVLVQGLLPLVSLYLMKQIVDMVTAGLSAPDPAAAFPQVGFFILLAGGTAFLAVFCRSLADLAGEAQSLIITDAVSDMLHSQSIAVDLAYYEDPSYYDTLHRAQQEAPYRPTRIVNGLIGLAQCGFSLVGIGILFFSFNPLLAVLLFAAAVPGALMRLFHARSLYDFTQNHTETERRADYYHWMLTDLGHAKEIRLFNLGPVFKEHFHGLRQELRKGRLTLARQRGSAEMATQFFATAAVFGMLAFVAQQTIVGALTLGGLVMYYQGFQSGLGFMQGILRGLAGLYEDNLFLSNFYRFLDLAPAVTSPPNPAPVPKTALQELVFKKVSFTYPGSVHEVLSEIDLALAPGQVIALVGENGSGKTTLVKLLSRLYDPAAGKITFGDCDLRDFDLTAWRQEISVIFQDYVRYYLTARDNIRFGNVESSPGMERIVAAARRSGADALISSMPQGYETVLGHQFNKGEELSIGQWQKIALARAFLRDARILVLDEPTSSLDPLAEEELFRQFRSMIAGRSAILISHRFTTVQLADYIYVLEQGKITEQGTHQDLLRMNGSYARLYHAQADRYQDAAAKPASEADPAKRMLT